MGEHLVGGSCWPRESTTKAVSEVFVYRIRHHSDTGLEPMDNLVHVKSAIGVHKVKEPVNTTS